MSAEASELPVLVGPGAGEPETLMLLTRPDANGVVHYRRWSALDWSAVPSAHSMTAKALFEWFEAALRQNRSANQSLTYLRSWLRQ